MHHKLRMYEEEDTMSNKSMCYKLCILAISVLFSATTGCGVSVLEGTITEAGEPMEGVTVTLAYAAGGWVAGTTTTGSDGKYYFAGLPADNFTITPSFGDYDFTPEQVTVTTLVGVPTIGGLDFVGEYGPDLIISALSMTSVTTTAIHYDFTIKNIGNVGVDLGSIEFPSDIAVQARLSHDQVVDPEDVAACGRVLTSGLLGPGEETVGESYFCNIDAEGYQYMILTVDSNDLLDELDETNNTMVVDLAESYPEVELIPAALLSVPAGDCVTYVGDHPGEPGQGYIQTYEFCGDGTATKMWNPTPVSSPTLPGNLVQLGDWEYVGNQLVITTSTMIINDLAEMISVEKYGIAFTYDDGAKLDMYSPGQVVPGDGGTILGDYALHSEMRVDTVGLVEAVTEAYSDTVAAVTQGAPGQADWVSTLTVELLCTGSDLVCGSVPGLGVTVTETNGTMERPGWLFDLGGSGTYILQTATDLVLDRQPPPAP